MCNLFNYKSIYLFAIVVLIGCQSSPKQNKEGGNPEISLANLSGQLAQYVKEKHLVPLMELYSNDVIFFPQYKAAILTKNDLQTFYKQLNDSLNILNYERKIIDTVTINNRIVETGLFSMTYLNKNSEATYSGNYMSVWKKENNSLKVEVEAFCSNYYLPKDSMPYHFFEQEYPSTYYQFDESDKIDREVLDLNNEVVKVVESGDTQGRIDGFHERAILMFNFAEVKIGIDSIIPKIKKIYYPGANLYTEHSFYDVRKIGENHVLIAAHYKGGWNRPNDTAKFEGNMLNLRSRNQEGKLVMFRQLTNSDR